MSALKLQESYCDLLRKSSSQFNNDCLMILLYLKNNERINDRIFLIEKISTSIPPKYFC